MDRYPSLLVPALIAIIPGLVIHSFIIVINVTDWMNGRSVTPVDHIITSLGISRMCAQFSFMLYVYEHMRSDLYISMDIIDLVNMFFNYAMLWLTSLLSIVFCVKISTLRTRLFLYLRRMIDQKTVHFIVVLGLFSVFNSLLPLWEIISDAMEGVKSNTTMENQSLNCQPIIYLYNYAIGPIIPLLFCSISSVLLFTSLYRHVTKMKLSGNLSINLETYYSAMTFVSITFICSTLYFIGYTGNAIYNYVYCEDLLWLCAVLEIPPVLHSSFLIYRTAKLRSHMSKVLHNVIYFLFQRKDPDNREGIDMVAQ